MLNSTLTLIDTVNEALSLVGLNPVVTSTDNHDSRVMIGLLKQAALEVQGMANWAELLNTEYLTEFSVKYNTFGHLGWYFSSQPKVHRVFYAPDMSPLCYKKPENFTQYVGEPEQVGFDSDVLSFDSTTKYLDADDYGNIANFYTISGMSILLGQPTRRALDYVVEYTTTISVPNQEMGVYNCTDELVMIIILCAAANYASVYLPARKKSNSPSSGLYRMYIKQAQLYRSRQTNRQGTTL